MRTRGINSEHTKRANRLLVMRLICTMREATRTEISERVGLNKMTVSNITAELLENGFIVEKELADSGRTGAGRRRVLLGLSKDAPAAVGLWISRDFCLGLAVSMDLQILARRQLNFSRLETGDTIVEKAAGVARELMAAAGRPAAGVGVASIGPLDRSQGILLNPPNFYNIRNFPLVSCLEKALRCPVFLQNDANAGALVEKYFGCCQNVKSFAYIGLTNGIGAGIVIKDSLFDGTGGFAGEFGHTVIDQNGPRCYCGNRGCLETLLSEPIILDRFSREFSRYFSTLGEVSAFCRENPAGEALMREFLGLLGTALINLANLLDPEVILMGHAGAELSDSQLSWLSERVNGGLFARGFTRVQVKRSSFGALAAVYGAAALVLKQIFDGKLLYETLFPN